MASKMMATSTPNTHRNQDSTDGLHLNFMSPSSINTQALPPLMDPPTASATKVSPPPALTKRFLTLLSPDKTVVNENAERTGGGKQKRDPAPSPTESVTQTLKAELEDLITYIDGLTFADIQNHTPRVDRNLTFGKDPTPMQPQVQGRQTLIYSPRGISTEQRPSQAIFRDRTNQEASPLIPPQQKKPGSLETTAHISFTETDPRLEPAGSPPSHDNSLYFHDESLSIILSENSDDIVDGSITDRAANITQSPPIKQTAASPSFISKLRENGILPADSSRTTHDKSGMKSKGRSIKFLPVSKDATPTKIPLESRIDGTPVTVREESSDTTRFWEVTPSREHSSNFDGDSFNHSFLQMRKATPFPRCSSRPFSITEDSEIKSGEPSVVQNLHEITNPSEMETPQPQTRSVLKVTSPETAKKILETAVEALKDARQEREEARQWAQDIKESVQQWVEEQQHLIRTESTSVAATSAASSAQVQQLESSINKLQSEIARSNSSRSHTEQRLEQLLVQQEDQIFAISKELHAVKDHLALIEKRASPRGKLNSFTPTKYPSTCHVNNFPSLSRHSTPKAKLDPSDRQHPGGSGRWSETSVSSSTGSRTRRDTPTGGHMVDYGNGVTKEVHPDGTTVTRFVNGDVETRFSDTSTPSGTHIRGIVAYFHNREGVLQITQKDGSILYEYSNGQMERHLPDGTKVVLFPDGTKSIVRGGGLPSC